ncbi:MAG: hypothetical protein ACI9S8_002330 [Chlamydiales bacterium]|jgi:hypothetical protein
MSNNSVVFSALESIAEILEIAPPSTNAENCWSLTITDYHSVYFSEARKGDHLYLYSPLMEGVPQDSDLLLGIYETALEKNMNYSNTQIGNISWDSDLELLLYYKRLVLKDLDEAFLVLFLPVFIEASFEWRKTLNDFTTGKTMKKKKSPEKGTEPPHHLKL